MNRNRKGAKPGRATIRAWTYTEAKNALPYIRSVMESLRERWIEAQNLDRNSRQLAAQPGRPDRTRLIAQEETSGRARQALDIFRDTQAELNALDVFCADPVRGEAVIPFVHENELAWFIYELFEPEPIRFWRRHSDPLDTRRPIAEAIAAPQPS